MREHVWECFANRVYTGDVMTRRLHALNLRYVCVSVLVTIFDPQLCVDQPRKMLSDVLTILSLCTISVQHFKWLGKVLDPCGMQF